MSVLTVRALKFVVGQFDLEADFELLQPVTGIFGPSGAGKTTLLELIAGLRVPKSGKITVREKLLYDGPARIALRPLRGSPRRR